MAQGAICCLVNMDVNEVKVAISIGELNVLVFGETTQPICTMGQMTSSYSHSGTNRGTYGLPGQVPLS
jgi:hypothetical protein